MIVNIPFPEGEQILICQRTLHMIVISPEYRWDALKGYHTSNTF